MLTMSTQSYVVRARWDEDSRTWWTDGEDIPGPCCQAKNFEELVDLVLSMAPGLLRANGLASPGAVVDIPIRVIAEREGMAHVIA
jgi:hypothetical protein